MPDVRHARPGRPRTGPARAAPAMLIMFLSALVPACDRATTPGETGAAPESGALLSRLGALGPAFAEEAERLLPAVGDRYGEQPLRLALRTVRDRMTAEEMSELGQMVDETMGLVRSYQPDDEVVDPAELDAIQLLITGIGDVAGLGRAAAATFNDADLIKGTRRPS